MANLISVKTFTGYDGSTQSVATSPSIELTINTYKIQDVKAYTPSPAISGVNTMLTVSYTDGNSERLGTLLINETVAAVKTAANAALA